MNDHPNYFQLYHRVRRYMLFQGIKYNPLRQVIAEHGALLLGELKRYALLQHYCKRHQQDLNKFIDPNCSIFAREWLYD